MIKVYYSVFYHIYFKELCDSLSDYVPINSMLIVQKRVTRWLLLLSHLCLFFSKHLLDKASILKWDLWKKLHPIKPIVGNTGTVYGSVRREELGITRLRLGHTYLTHVVFSWRVMIHPSIFIVCQCINNV